MVPSGCVQKRNPNKNCQKKGENRKKKNKKSTSLHFSFFVIQLNAFTFYVFDFFLERKRSNSNNITFIIVSTTTKHTASPFSPGTTNLKFRIPKQRQNIHLMGKVDSHWQIMLGRKRTASQINDNNYAIFSFCFQKVLYVKDILI